MVTTEQFHDVVIDFSDLNTSHPSSYFSAAGTPFSITSTTYDAQGRTAWTDDPHMPGQPTDGTQTIYDADGRVIASERFHDVNIGYTIGTDGIASSPSVTADASPYLITDTIYDTAGRVVWTDDGHAPGTTPNGTNTVYDTAGRVISTGRYANVLITLTIDPSTGVASNALTSTPTLISSTSSTYNAAGQLLTSTDAKGYTTQYTYDADGRLIKTSYFDGTFATTSYDPTTGRKTAAMDQAGQITNYTYDQYGNLASVSLPDPDTAGGTNRPTYTYTYDNYGDLLTETDPLNNTTSYAYDAFGRKVSETLPTLPDNSTPTETWSYNAPGQLASTTDFDGHVITYTYDDQGRVTAKDEYVDATHAQAGPADASKVVTYTYDNYDSQNRRYDTVTIADTASPNDNGTTTTYYDTAGDIVEIDSPQGDITYTYNDSTGQKTGETTNNTDIQYAYDQEGRLATVTVDKLDGASVTPLVTTYSYDLNNNLITTSFPNGTVETRTYDALNRLLTVKTTDGSSTIVGYTYTLDADGRRVQVVEATGRTVNYTYDNDGRLTQEKITNDPSGDNWTYTYTYDLAGNRLSLNDNGPNNDSLSYTYDADGRLSDVSGTTGTNGDSIDTTYTYDANGSMLTSTTTINSVQTSQTTYTWDLEGRMIAAVTTGTGAVSATYTYDDNGDRTSQTVNNQTTTYLNDPNQAYDQVLEEYAPGGVLAATYVRGLDLLFQDRTAAGGGTGLSFYAVDGLGSNRALTDQNGNVTDTDTYDAYGNLIASTGTTPNEFLYAGYLTDTTTGLDDLGARYYTAAAGQFTSRDGYNGSTSDPITQNHYAYAGASPVDNIDPNGHDFSLGEAMLGSTIGATLDSIEGTAGQFILNSLEKKQVDWEYIGTEAILSLVPLATYALGGLLSKLLARNLAALRSGFSLLQNSKYIIGPSTKYNQAIDKIDELVSFIKGTGWQLSVIDSFEQVGKAVRDGVEIPIAGKINSYINNDGSKHIVISLYKGWNEATLLEELIHAEQLYNDNLLGKTFSKLQELVYEAEAAHILINDYGFVVNKN